MAQIFVNICLEIETRKCKKDKNRREHVMQSFKVEYDNDKLFWWTIRGTPLLRFTFQKLKPHANLLVMHITKGLTA